MLKYLAPMEGVTTFTYRNAYRAVFDDIDKYMTPFICPTPTKGYQSKEYKEMNPENNKGADISIQLLTNDADLLLKGAKDLKELGYNDININLGCPSGTVVSKNRGSGFLAYPFLLDEFLNKSYNGLEKLGMKMSIKTRIGKYSSDDFGYIMEIYDQYPVSELIIHPRIQKDMYKNHPNMEVFKMAYDMTDIPLVYNGDVNTVSDFYRIKEEYPKLIGIMMGRGICANPLLPTLIKTREYPENSKDLFRKFNNELYDRYLEHIPERKNVLFKMKEVWIMMINSFEDNEKYLKMIKKSQTLDELMVIIDSAITNLSPDKSIL